MRDAWFSRTRTRTTRFNVSGSRRGTGCGRATMKRRPTKVEVTKWDAKLNKHITRLVPSGGLAYPDGKYVKPPMGECEAKGVRKSFGSGA